MLQLYDGHGLGVLYTGSILMKILILRIAVFSQINFGVDWMCPIKIHIVSLLSHVWLVCDLADCSLPGFSVHGVFQDKKHWSGLPLPPTGDLPDPGLNLCLSHWQADSLPLSHHRSAYAKAVSSNIAFGDKIFGKWLCLDEAVRVKPHDGFVPL